MITKKRLKALTLIWENKLNKLQEDNKRLRKQLDILDEFYEKVNTGRVIPTEEYLEKYGYSFMDKENREWVLEETLDGYRFGIINYNDFEQEERNAEEYYILKTLKQAQKFILDRIV